MARSANRSNTPVQTTLDDMDGIGPGEAGFGGPQVCKIVGITYRQLDYWARTDLVRPSVADAAGSGTQRRYSYRDLVRLKVIKSLLDAGVKLQSARTAIEYLKTDGESWETARLVLNGPASVLVRTDGELIDAVRNGQTVLNLVPLSHVVGEVSAAIHELYPEIEQPVTGSPRTDGVRRAAGGG